MQIALVKDVIDRVGPDQEIVWKQVRSYEANERWPEWSVEVALKDIHVEIVNPCDIVEVLESGMY
jgi:hypothetical protein